MVLNRSLQGQPLTFLYMLDTSTGKTQEPSEIIKKMATYKFSKKIQFYICSGPEQCIVYLAGKKSARVRKNELYDHADETPKIYVSILQ